MDELDVLSKQMLNGIAQYPNEWMSMRALMKFLRGIGFHDSPETVWEKTKPLYHKNFISMRTRGRKAYDFCLLPNGKKWLDEWQKFLTDDEPKARTP